jgi:hypothetical protein
MELRDALEKVRQMGQEVIQRIEQFKIVWEHDWERVLVEVSELEKKRDELIPKVASLEKETREKESTLAAVNAELHSLKKQLVEYE